MDKTLNEAAIGSGKLLDVVISTLRLKNDAALSRVLGVSPVVISKLRHGKLHVGPSMLIRIHEETGMSVRDMKSFLAKPAELADHE